MTEDGNVCLELGAGAETGCKQAQGNILVWGNGNVSEMFLNWIVVMTEQLCKFIKKKKKTIVLYS